MKKRFTLAIAAFAAIGMFVGCATVKPVSREAGKAYTLVVLNSNDTHGAVEATDSGAPGLASVAAFVKQARAQDENVLYLHAGDMNTGQAISNMFNAEPDIVSFNAMGLDAAAFGNHEFDGSLEKLQHQMEISAFPWLSANIKQGANYLGKPYIIKDYEGFRVAVIGLTTLRTLVIASPDKSLTFIDEIEAAKEAVQTVREKELADVVIVLAHLGDVQETEEQNTSIKLAEQVSGIDLIIDGHSHTYMEQPRIVNGTPIVSANEHGKYVGDGVMTIVDGKVVNFTWQAVQITPEAFPPDGEVVALLQPYVDEARASLSEVVLTTTAEFEFGNRLTRYQEMPIGDFVADALVAYVESTGVHVDAGFTNGGGIRTSLPQGDVTRENIMTVLPFENYVYVLTLNGSDVVELFNFIGSIKQGAGAFAQVSKEIRYTITYDAEGNGTISDVTIGGAPIDPNRTYRFATNDYLAGGGDGYTVLTKSIDTYNTSMLLSTVVIDYAQSLQGAITPTTDGRIRVVGGTLPE